MKNKLKANGYSIIKLALVCCALLTFSVMGIITVLPQINATRQIALDTTTPTDITTVTPAPTATDTPTPTPVPTATPIPTAVPTTPPPPPTVVPTTPPIIVKPTSVPTRIPTAIPAPPATATSIASQTATAVASATPITTTPTPTATVGAASSPTAVATQQAVTAISDNTPPGNGGGPNIVLPVTIVLVMLLIAGSLGGLVLLRKRGIPAFGLAALGSTGQKPPSIPWTRNKKIGPAPVIENGNAPSLQAGAFAANGQTWTAPNNAQTMIGASAPAFAAAAGMLPLNSQPSMHNSNQPYTPSALRPITTSLPAEYPNSRPFNTIQTSDMRPLPMDSLDFSKVFNQQADADKLRQLSPQVAPGAYSGVATQAARPATAPIAVPPPSTPAPAGNLNTGPVVVPPQSLTPPPARPATPTPPPAASLLTESQLTSDPMLETIMRQAQMGLYVLPDKQTPNRPDTNH